jgi:hypothetical protein
MSESDRVTAADASTKAERRKEVRRAFALAVYGVAMYTVGLAVGLFSNLFR